MTSLNKKICKERKRRSERASGKDTESRQKIERQKAMDRETDRQSGIEGE